METALMLISTVQKTLNVVGKKEMPLTTFDIVIPRKTTNARSEITAIAPSIIKIRKKAFLLIPNIPPRLKL